MKALPPSLDAWASWLSWFSPELQSVLTVFLHRLAPLLGPLDRPDREGRDDVDGLGDLHRRGTYQRLLSSEWLLAIDLPDEFLRRAVSHEHLFLAPRRRAPRNGRVFVALFDAGPLQLGAPRVAHVAMWILLARRAAQAGGWLRWGVLQAPGQWHDAADAADLKQLLGMRSFELAQPRHQQAWQASLDALDAEPQEVWRIGTKTDRGMALLRSVTHQAGFSRGLDPLWLDMEIRQGGISRQARLELPAASQAVRLLQGNFLAPVQASVRHTLGFRVALRQPVLSTSGHRAALHLMDGSGLLVVQIPSASKAKDAKVTKGKRIQWSKGASPLGISFSGKRVTALVGLDGKLCVWNAHGFSSFERPDADEFQAPPGTASSLPSAHLQSDRIQQYMVVDQAGRLVCWHSEDGAASKARPGTPMPQRSERVLGLWQMDNTSALCVSLFAGWLWVRKLNPRHAEGNMPVCQAAGDKVLFGGGADWRQDVGACALRLHKAPHESWRLNVPLGPPGSRERREGPTGPNSMAFRHVDVDLPAGWQGVGVVASNMGVVPYAMLALDHARKGLHVHTGERSELAYAAPSRIHSVTVCANTGMLVLLTEDRQFIAYAMADRSLRTITQLSAS